MLFTFLAVAAAPQALALRPSAMSSAMSSAQFGKLRDFVANADSSSDPTTALKEVASVVNSIMIQAGNATDHLTADDQALFERVIVVLRDVMYSSMTASHVSDETALAYAIAAISQCGVDFAARVADGGDLTVMENTVRTYQNTLNGLQDDVDIKTSHNDTAWSTLYSHMNLISPAPDCAALPSPKTMASLDIFFDSSDYVSWWTSQKGLYEPLSAAFKYADQQLREALTAYAVGLAVRDVGYCDWKRELDAACDQLSSCYEAAKAHYLNDVKPVVEVSMKDRIEAFKAGETIIHQINFLLAKEADQATPAINTDVYQIAFPEVPAKPACDLSALDDAVWVPAPNCHDEEQLVEGCASGTTYAQYGVTRMEDGNKVAGEAVCCDPSSNKCTRHIKDDEAWFLTVLSHEHCTTDSTGVIVDSQTPPSHSFHQAQAMCRSVGWRLPKTQAEVETTCGTGCHIDATLVWIDPGSAWKLVARQTSGAGWFSQGQWSKNSNDPSSANYAILDQLENFRDNQGGFEFKLSWPDSTHADQHWRQTSNPVTTGSGVQGYEAISAPSTVQMWGGLEGQNSPALLDGSVSHGNWWYAVGSFRQYGGGIPGPNQQVVQKVELYVKH